METGIQNVPKWIKLANETCRFTKEHLVYLFIGALGSPGKLRPELKSLMTERLEAIKDEVHLLSDDDVDDRVSKTTRGFYNPGNSEIAVRYSHMKNIAERYKTVFHEVFHKLSDNDKGTIGGSTALNEGLTELFAMMCASQTKKIFSQIKYSLYPHETFNAFLLTKVFGVEPVLECYLTTDTGRLKNMVDEKFGEGSFERFFPPDDKSGSSEGKSLLEHHRAILSALTSEGYRPIDLADMLREAREKYKILPFTGD